MTYSVFIDGAAGTTGLEIADRLAGRSEFSVIALDESNRKSDAARREAINDADFVILCLPDDAAIAAAAMVANDRTRIIDASTAHRVAPDWTYGFHEFRAGRREMIAASARVSNPGCYPTGFLALIAPLVDRGLIPADWPYSCNAVSGYSGGGKALIGRFADEPDLAFRAYGLDLDHKHMPEMRLYAGLQHDVIFAPAVVPAYRGMWVELPLPLAAMGAKARGNDVRSALEEQYRDSAIVHVLPVEGLGEVLLKENALPSDRLDLFVFASKDGTRVRLCARLDNLGKGASGAAVQSLNIMAGIEETAGLRLGGL